MAAQNVPPLKREGDKCACGSILSLCYGRVARAYRTFLALARTPVRPAEHSDVSLGMISTCRARCLAGPLLIEASKAVAADATELPNFGLEVTYTHGTSEGWRTERPGRAHG